MRCVVVLFCAVFALTLLAGCNQVEYRSDSPEKKPLPAATEKKKNLQLVWSASGPGSLKADTQLRLGLTQNLVVKADTRGGLQALDKITGKTKWQHNTGANISAGPTVIDQRIIVGTREGKVLAFHLSDGQKIWDTNVSGEVLAAPTGNREVVLVNTLEGSLVALNARNGQMLWRYYVEAPSIVLRQNSRPVLSTNKVLSGFANGRLVALNRQDGLPLWEREIAVPKGRSDIQRIVGVHADPVILNGVVYVVGFQGKIAALNEETGEPLWDREISSHAGLTVAKDKIFVSDTQGSVWALDRSSGKVLWQEQGLMGRHLTKPTVLGNKLVVGDETGYLHFLSLDTGKYLERISVDSKGIDMPPLWQDNQLYVLGRGGKLAVFQLARH